MRTIESGFTLSIKVWLLIITLEAELSITLKETRKRIKTSESMAFFVQFLSQSQTLKNILWYEMFDPDVLDATEGTHVLTEVLNRVIRMYSNFRQFRTRILLRS